MADKNKSAIKNRERYSTNTRRKMVNMDFSAVNSLVLSDINNTKSKSYTIYSKSKLRDAIKNPKQNEQALREISQFLYRVSAQYRRLIKYQAEMLPLPYNVIPLINYADDVDYESVLNDYYSVCALLQKMNLPHELKKVLTVSWREDCFYGYIYETDNTFYIMPLDGQYCKLSSIEDGCYNFAFDFSYFKKYPVYLEYWDKEFKQKYSKYESGGNSMKWQELDPAKTICIKINEENAEEVIPPMIGIFEDLLDIIDYKSLLKNREELSNYKLIVQKIPLIGNSKDVNDFAIDLDDAIAFGDRLSEATPELVGSVVTPMDIDTVEFKKDDTSDINMVSQATQNMLDAGGYSRMLWNSDKGGSVGLDASIKTDEAMSLEILKQIQRWTNRYVKTVLNGTSVSVKFHDITIFNRGSYLSDLQSQASLGLPVKLEWATAKGMTPLEVQGAMILENDILKLHEKFIPLTSSYQQSANSEVGAPTVDDGELTEEGLASRDGNKNQDTIET